MSPDSFSRYLALLLVGASIATAEPRALPAPYPTVGIIERLDPALDAIIAKNTVIEKIAEGFALTEGAVWDQRDSSLLFSDLPRNRVHRWSPPDKLTIAFEPSGYTGPSPAPSKLPGANGLAFDRDGRLLLCQHGDRRLARREPDGTFTTLADRFEGKRLSSPNDLVVAPNGDIYFSDPPWGLPLDFKDPANELGFHGVFLLRPTGELVLLARDLRPNGLALSPDGRTLYLADGPRLLAGAVQPDGTLGERRPFWDATPLRRGVIDGLKVDPQGNLYVATFTSAINILSPDGRLLGAIITGRNHTNCAFGDDGSTLYITASQWLVRVRLLTRGPTAAPTPPRP